MIHQVPRRALIATVLAYALVTRAVDSVGWMSRFRRLARDQERLADVLKGFHLIAFSMLMWKQAFPILSVL